MFTKGGIFMGNRMEPIRDIKKIKDIKDILKNSHKWRDYLLFVTGLNFGLRIGDLLKIQIKKIVDFNYNIEDRFCIIEEKTNKRNIIKINDEVKNALELIREKTDLLDNIENYLIYNTKDKRKSISRVQAYKLVRKWCNAVGLTDLAVGTHTLRKSWGHHAHKAGISIEVIQAKYLHNSTSTTREYLGIERKDVSEAYDRVRL